MDGGEIVSEQTQSRQTTGERIIRITLDSHSGMQARRLGQVVVYDFAKTECEIGDDVRRRDDFQDREFRHWR